MRTAVVRRTPRDDLARQHVPAFVHLAHDRRDARVRTVAPARRQFALAPAIVAFVRAHQPAFHPALETGIRGDGDHLADGDHRGLFLRHDVFHRDQLSTGYRGHPVVRNDDHVDAVAQAAFVQPAQQPRQCGIRFAHRGVRLRRLRAVAMAGLVDALEIQGGDARTRGIGLGQPAQHRVHAGVVGQGFAVAIFVPARGANAADGGFAARPIHRRAAQAGLLRADPDRLAAPPAAIAHRQAVGQLEAAQCRIAHGVVHDALVVRDQAGDDAVVVGEGERRIRRRHPARTHALARDARQRGGDAEVQVVGAEAVERDEQDAAAGVVRGHGGRRVCGVLGGDGRTRGAGGERTGEQRDEETGVMGHGSRS